MSTEGVSLFRGQVSYNAPFQARLLTRSRNLRETNDGTGTLVSTGRERDIVGRYQRRADGTLSYGYAGTDIRGGYIPAHEISNGRVTITYLRPASNAPTRSTLTREQAIRHLDLEHVRGNTFERDGFNGTYEVRNDGTVFFSGGSHENRGRQIALPPQTFINGRWYAGDVKLAAPPAPPIPQADEDEVIPLVPSREETPPVQTEEEISLPSVQSAPSRFDIHQSLRTFLSNLQECSFGEEQGEVESLLPQLNQAAVPGDNDLTQLIPRRDPSLNQVVSNLRQLSGVLNRTGQVDLANQANELARLIAPHALSSNRTQLSPITVGANNGLTTETNGQIDLPAGVTLSSVQVPGARQPHRFSSGPFESAAGFSIDPNTGAYRFVPGHGVDGAVGNYILTANNGRTITFQAITLPPMPYTADTPVVPPMPYTADTAVVPPMPYIADTPVAPPMPYTADTPVAPPMPYTADTPVVPPMPYTADTPVAPPSGGVAPGIAEQQI